MGPTPKSNLHKALVLHPSLIFGWHALRLCEGRGVGRSNHALPKASGRATQTQSTQKLKLDRALVTKPGADHDTVLQIEIVGRRFPVE